MLAYQEFYARAQHLSLLCNPALSRRLGTYLALLQGGEIQPTTSLNPSASMSFENPPDSDHRSSFGRLMIHESSPSSNLRELGAYVRRFRIHLVAISASPEPRAWICGLFHMNLPYARSIFTPSPAIIKIERPKRREFWKQNRGLFQVQDFLASLVGLRRGARRQRDPFFVPPGLHYIYFRKPLSLVYPTKGPIIDLTCIISPNKKNKLNN